MPGVSPDASFAWGYHDTGPETMSLMMLIGKMFGFANLELADLKTECPQSHVALGAGLGWSHLSHKH